MLGGCAAARPSSLLCGGTPLFLHKRMSACGGVIHNVLSLFWQLIIHAQGRAWWWQGIMPTHALFISGVFLVWLRLPWIALLCCVGQILAVGDACY
jgi:hypothetical protein